MFCRRKLLSCLYLFVVFYSVFFAFVEKVAIFAEEAFAIGFQLIEWRLDAILLTFKFYVYEKAFCCLGFFVLPVGL